SQGVLAGEDPTGGVTHYFIGSKAAEWQTGVSHYSRVQVRGLYPGIDLTYYFREERLEFDLTIRPGSDPEMLHFEMLGATHRAIEPTGDLTMQSDGQRYRLRSPHA